MIILNNKRQWLFRLILVLSLFIISGCSAGENSDLHPEPEEEPAAQTEIVDLKGYLVEMELALNPAQRALGLMGRETMADDKGMLFVFPAEEPYPKELFFWMKDCLMPIDVLFISKDGTITAIHEMQPPLKGVPDEELPAYSSNSPAQFAIELRGGLANEIGLKPGDIIELRRDYLLSLAE